MRKIMFYLAAAGLMTSLVGCVRSEMFVMVRDADAKVAAAEAAGAATAAPYEFESAKAWLAFAKHEADEFDMAGEEFAKKALDYIDAAMKKVKGGAK